MDKVVGFYTASPQESLSEAKDKLLQPLQLAVVKDIFRRLLAAVGAVEGEAQEGRRRVIFERRVLWASSVYW